MPTHDRLSLSAALAWLRVQVDRFRHSLMARHPSVRWGMAVVAVIGLTSLVYWTATSRSTLNVRYLVSGRRFSSDDLITVCRTLDKQRVAYRVDDLRRIEVSADQYETAADAVAKLDLGPRSLSEIREESILSSFLETAAEREQRKQLFREKTIERLIGDLDGVVWSLVSINHPPARKWHRQGAKPTAFVYIETEGMRQLPYKTLQAIPEILAGNEDELTRESITVMDTRGNKYFESGNAAVGIDAHNRAREEELVSKILDQLEWIKGLRVQVRVPDSRPVGLVAAPSANKRDGGASASKPGGSVAAIFVNRPVDSIEPEAASRPPAAGKPVATNAADGSSSRSGHTADYQTTPTGEPGHVLIWVPRSYYLNADLRGETRDPHHDGLLGLRDRTEEWIRKAVGLITPPSESWKVEINMIVDQVSLDRPLLAPSAVSVRRRALDWGIVGTVVAIVSIVAAAGSWVKAARRPLVLPEAAVTTRHYHVDSASEPGPSERVRELVRRNPEAAASVLQRWTGQGGRG